MRVYYNNIDYLTLSYTQNITINQDYNQYDYIIMKTVFAI